MPGDAPWHDRWPEVFEIETEGCPMAMLEQMDGWTARVLALTQDYRAGLLPGWPHAYTAAAVEAVRYLLHQSSCCERWQYDQSARGN